MASIKPLVRIAVAAVAAVLHVWHRAVLATPEVKRRKAARRRARRV